LGYGTAHAFLIDALSAVKRFMRGTAGTGAGKLRTARRNGFHFFAFALRQLMRERGDVWRAHLIWRVFRLIATTVMMLWPVLAAAQQNDWQRYVVAENGAGVELSRDVSATKPGSLKPTTERGS
jgi:hypothetical protein